MNWHDYFTYDNGNLIWKVALNRKIQVGKVAGCKKPNGYIYATINGGKYAVHRIVWEMHNGPIPEEMEIDHKWGIRCDNRISELRLVTSTGNHRNMAKRSDNTSGVTGVTFCKKRQMWKAYIKQYGKLTHLGYFADINEAISKRKVAEKEYGFSSRHGL